MNCTSNHQRNGGRNLSEANETQHHPEVTSCMIAIAAMKSIMDSQCQQKTWEQSKTGGPQYQKSSVVHNPMISFIEPYRMDENDIDDENGHRPDAKQDILKNSTYEEKSCNEDEEQFLKKSKAPKCWKSAKTKTIVACNLVFLITISLIFFLRDKSKTTQGNNVQTCPIKEYSTSPCELKNKPAHNYGRILVGEDVWFCGGHASHKDMMYDQKSCVLHNIFNIEMRRLNYKMNYPRVKPQMAIKGNKVIVSGGTTSDISSRTGCRKTQEVFDTCNPSAGWIVEDISENESCHVY